MRKHGRTAANKQRWRCPQCRLTGIRRRPDARTRRVRTAFLRWLCGCASLTEIARQLRISTRTLRRHFAPLWEHDSPPSPPQQPADVLILDALYLGARKTNAQAVLIAKTPNEIYAWRFAKAETKAAWADFLLSLPPPRYVVSDGCKPLTDAVSTHFPNALRQRCMAHVIRYTNAFLRARPRLPANTELTILLRQLSFVDSRHAREEWLYTFRQWEQKYAGVLSARWWKTDRRNHSYAMRVYPSLCRARGHLAEALPHLFSYLECRGAPRTTNYVEGGINARLRELLRRHRGLNAARRRVLTAHFLAPKPKKTTQNVH